MKATFKFHKIASDLVGHIYRPYADVLVYGRDDKHRRITMLVDTGADYTIFPRREAALLGIDLERDCAAHTTYGAGGPQTVHLIQGLEVQLGEARLAIPVGFLEQNDVPPQERRHWIVRACGTRKRLGLRDQPSDYVEVRGVRLRAYHGDQPDVERRL